MELGRKKMLTRHHACFFVALPPVIARVAITHQYVERRRHIMNENHDDLLDLGPASQETQETPGPTSDFLEPFNAET